jgi:hypothetical protein
MTSEIGLRTASAQPISSDRTPVQQAKPGDWVRFYMSGEGFVAEAEISSPPRKPY